MQIQYFERLNPEMECIYLLERRYQAGEDAPHSIPALRDYLSGKYNIPMFELEAMLQPLIDLENYVVSNLQVSEEQLRFFFSSRGGTTSALARPLYAVLHSRPHYGSLPEAEKLGALKRVLARVLGLETEDLAGIDSFDALIRFLLQSPATEDVKWICTALFYSIDDYMEELDIILRKATALFLEHVPDTAASLCRSAMKDAKAKIGDDPVALFVKPSKTWNSYSGPMIISSATPRACMWAMALLATLRGYWSNGRFAGWSMTMTSPIIVSVGALTNGSTTAVVMSGRKTMSLRSTWA